MKKQILTMALGIVMLILKGAANTQLVSTQSGFYPVDSLLFTVKQAPPPGGKIEISVNCFSADKCFREYKRGFWLYSRNNAPNTWEDQQFSQVPTSGTVDILAHRGALDKVNVVRVRVKDAKGNVVSDEAYFIGILGKGATYPYKLPVVQLLVDSMDAFGPYGFYGPGVGIRNQYVHVWNYEINQSAVYSAYVPRSRVEKPCIMQVTDTGNRLLLYQKCGIHVTGIDSRKAPNKSMEVEARKEYHGPDMFEAGFLESKKAIYHSIRFRSGGSGQERGFGAHEIAEGIIEGAGVGEVPVRPVVLFLNGSYWSLSFAQADIEDYALRDARSPEKVSFFKPEYFVRTPEFVNEMKNQRVDTQRMAWTSIAGKEKVVATGLLEQGTKDLFMPVSKRMISAIENDEPLSFATIDSLIDLNSWLGYIAIADFGRIVSSIEHHIFMGTAPDRKMFLLMDEAKDFAMQDPAGNHWKEHILVSDSTNSGEKTFEELLIRQIILKNKTCIEKLCLRYQDLLNTNFKPERTVQIIDKLSKDFLPEYGRYWKSWYPNSGLDSAGEVALMASMKDFCHRRPDIAWQQLAEQWLPDDHLTLSDRGRVSIVLDSVPKGSVAVHLNSLTIKNSWSGLYYRNPALEVSFEPLKVPAGYELVWKEHPTIHEPFRISTLTDITLTPVLRRVTK